MKFVSETCPRCHGFVWHRRDPCKCKPSPVPVSDLDILYAIGCRLKACRLAQQLSLDELAARTGLSKTGIWQIECGESEPMARTLIALANELSVTTDYLLMREVK
jgi:DNA-binding XRE family transcriptional regulator